MTQPDDKVPAEHAEARRTNVLLEEIRSDFRTVVEGHSLLSEQIKELREGQQRNYRQLQRHEGYFGAILDQLNTLQGDVEVLKAGHAELKAGQAELKAGQERHQSTLDFLLTESKQLRAAHEQLRLDVAELRSGQQELRREVAELREGQDDLRQEVAELRKGQDGLRREVAELRMQQGAMRDDLKRIIARLDNHEERLTRLELLVLDS